MIQITHTNNYNEILTNEAIQFISKLESSFRDKRKALLYNRKIVQQQIDEGNFPNFLEETKFIRKKSWKVATIPKDLIDRRVEITGPVERKMIINALNSGANVFMADFEDSNSPTWDNNLKGQANLIDAVNKTIIYTTSEKQYALKDNIATLMIRPRGWHLEEKHILLSKQPFSASIFDFGLFFFHNAKKLIEQGSGPYFYLPKLENHMEARLWNEVFQMAQDELNIPQGTIRATVLIETILAAFEMDEILFELKEHSAGLNCGRWDYIFSFIKKFRNHPEFVLPDRSQVTMTTHFLSSYSKLLVKTCHRRGIHAMGGMAAQIPIKNDPIANEKALEKVKADKEREVKNGHDGTWVAHPALVPVAKEIFDKFSPNQIDKQKRTAIIANDLLKIPEGTITEEGIRTNVNVSLIYLESWLNGFGCVPINNLMEDLATCCISRTQLWQWIKHKAKTNKNVIVDKEMIDKMIEVEKFNERTISIFKDVVFNENLHDFLPDVLYSYL